MISRRRLLSIAGGFVVVPRAAQAQHAEKVWRIGILDAAESDAWLGFREGLRDVGLEAGRGVTVEFRWIGAQPDGYRESATELTRIGVDVFVTGNWESTRAAKQATNTIPIVMLGVTDPPAAGLVGRFDRPDGNVT